MVLNGMHPAQLKDSVTSTFNLPVWLPISVNPNGYPPLQLPAAALSPVF